jgi:hypothetical protein
MILTGFADPDESVPSSVGEDRRSASWSVPPPALAGLEDQLPSARPSVPPSVPAPPSEPSDV